MKCIKLAGGLWQAHPHVHHFQNFGGLVKDGYKMTFTRVQVGRKSGAGYEPIERQSRRFEERDVESGLGAKHKRSRKSSYEREGKRASKDERRRRREKGGGRGERGSKRNASGGGESEKRSSKSSKRRSRQEEVASAAAGKLTACLPQAGDQAGVGNLHLVGLNDDALLAIARFLTAKDLLSLKLTCRRFNTKYIPAPRLGGNGGGGGVTVEMLSIVEEAAWRWVAGCSGQERGWVPRRELASWLCLMHEVEGLRAPLVFGRAHPHFALTDGGAVATKTVGYGSLLQGIADMPYESFNLQGSLH